MTFRSKTALTVALLAGLALAGCNKPQPAAETETSEDNMAASAPEPAPEPTPVVAEPAPVEKKIKPVADAAPPEPKISDDQQMQEDAEATGMTARVSRSDDSGAAAAKDADDQ